jgi:hypothetical protein
VKPRPRKRRSEMAAVIAWSVVGAVLLILWIGFRMSTGRD